ncbi:MAG TPA: Crp/Fnr family transcriptional regulator [Sphingomicrobium sp.]|jgi:CRP-like cAMP-binding protein|nr:Crp/Fnr family transcriptional regulator [Sphingomicrobium sp.]
MITAHLKKLRLRTAISADEERVIRDLVAETRAVRPDQFLIRAGQDLNQSILLLDGWLVRSKDLESGERQILEVHLPGDFADLHGFTLKRLDHDVVSVSECVIALVPHERLLELTEQQPHLTRIYWLLTNIDAAIAREQALSLGRRSAISRMAHLFCELHLRLGIVGKTDGDTFEFPLTQRELSECLGLTVVHVNRTLQELRRRNVVESENRRISIIDRPTLESIAEFDPAYLQLDKRRL